MNLTSKPKIRKVVAWTGVILVALFAFLYWTSKTAWVSPVVRGDATDTVSANFSVREKHLSRLTARNLPVTIRQVHFELGDRAKEGDLLVNFVDTSHQQRLEEAQLDLMEIEEIMELKSRLEFQLERLLEDYDLAEKQRERGMISKKEFVDLGISIKETEANIKREALANELRLSRIKNQIQRTQLNLGHMELFSPKDGLVYAIYRREGEVAKPWEPIMDLIYQEKSVVADVSERDIERISVGSNCLLKFLAYQGRTFTGKITYILPKQNPLMKTFDVYIDAEVPQELMIPGLNGEVSFRLDQRSNALLVPNEAIMQDVVLVVNRGRVERRVVEVGYKGLIMTEILNGVQEGEFVIVRELTRYPEGSYVKTRIR
jgi:RND family efflux transporter MFP subunit